MKLKDLKVRVKKRSRLSPETRFDRYFARRLSIYITWVLAHTKISPNQVTASQLAVGAVGCCLLGTGRVGLVSIGVGLLHFSYILDCVDGEIARLKGSSSLTVVFFDEASHSIFNSMLYAGLAFNSYWASGNALPFFFGFAAVIFTPAYGVLYLHDALIRALKSNLGYQSIKVNLSTPSSDWQGSKSSRPLKLYKKIAYKTGFFFTIVPYSTNLVTVALILDLTLNQSLPEGISFLYITLIYFGLTLPLRHVGGLTRSIIQGKADAEYKNLFESENRKNT